LANLPKDPEDYRIYWARGYAYLSENNKYAEAFTAYEKAIELSKTGTDFDYELLADMANFYICTGRPAEAVKNLKTAIADDPQLRHFYLDYLGWALVEDGQNERAVRTLKAIDPIQEQYKVFLAVAFANLGGECEKLAKGVMEEIKETNSSFNLDAHVKWIKDDWHYQNEEQITTLFERLRKI
jgi:tetratricopeptide (TPR) repeat protein